MTNIYDLVIRGGLVVDGTGAEPRRADVAISAGVIAAIGRVEETGAEEIDATGLLVTPGFVDLHTHYDGQAIWSSRINPSSSHGVTTVVVGNCGVGFAPCKPQDRDLLVSTMEGVEDIPGVVMREGLTWDWETFPEYLDALDQKRRDIDIASYVPHSAVRVYAMGRRGADREPATEDDLKTMSAIIEEAMKAGAIGFATSRTGIDRRSDGELVPSYAASERELIAAGHAVQKAGGGVMQLISENGVGGISVEDEFALMKRVTDAVKLPVTFTLLQAKHDPHRWSEMMRMATETSGESGGSLHPQYFPRSVGMIASFDLTSNPFLHCPTYKALAHLPLEERIVELRKPEVKAKIISEKPDHALLPLTMLTRNFRAMYPLTDPPNYEPDPQTSVAAQAKRQGRTSEDVAYDLLLENDGRAMLLVAIANYADENLDFVHACFDNPNAVMGLGDGGAHYGLICDSSYPTFVLAHWARDRSGKRISLGRAVKAMTSEPAKLIGLLDRGVLAPGYKADVNVIDHANLRLNRPEIRFDLPAGGRRLDQTANGYRWTIVSGEVIAKDDRPTGKLPGRLVRGVQAPPVAAAH